MDDVFSKQLTRIPGGPIGVDIMYCKVTAGTGVKKDGDNVNTPMLTGSKFFYNIPYSSGISLRGLHPTREAEHIMTVEGVQFRGILLNAPRSATINGRDTARLAIRHQ